MARVQKGPTMFRPKKKAGEPSKAAADNVTIAPATPAATQSAGSMAAPSQSSEAAATPSTQSAAAMPAPNAIGAAPPTPAATQKRPPSLIAAASASPNTSNGGREFVPRPGSVRRSVTPRDSTPGPSSGFRGKTPNLISRKESEGIPLGRSGARETVTPDHEHAAVPIGRPGQVTARPAVSMADDDDGVPIGRPGHARTQPEASTTSYKGDGDADGPLERRDQAQTAPIEDGVPIGRPGSRRVPSPAPADEGVPIGRPGAPRLPPTPADEGVPIGRPGSARPPPSNDAVPITLPGSRPQPATLAVALTAEDEAHRGQALTSSRVNSIPNAASTSRAPASSVGGRDSSVTAVRFEKRADGSTMAVPDPDSVVRKRGRPRIHPEGETRAQTIARKRAEQRAENGPLPKKKRKQRSDAGVKRARKRTSASASIGASASGAESGTESETGSSTPAKRARVRRKRQGIPNDHIDVDGLEANDMIGEQVDLDNMSMAELTRAHDHGRISARAITIQTRKAELQPAKEEAKRRAAKIKARQFRDGEIRQIKIRNYMRQQRRLEIEQGIAQQEDVERGVSDDEEIIVDDEEDDEDLVEDDGDEEAIAERKRRRAALMPVDVPVAPPAEAADEADEEMDLENMVFDDDAEAAYYDSDEERWVYPDQERAALARAEREQALDEEINDSEAEVEEIRDTDTWVNSASFRRKNKSSRGRKWNKQETDALYLALSMFGESASLIHQTVFSYMTLAQVKGKLRRENLDRPEKVTAALRDKIKLNRRLLESVLGIDLSKAHPEHEKPLPNQQKHELQVMPENDDVVTDKEPARTTETVSATQPVPERTPPPAATDATPRVVVEQPEHELPGAADL